MKKLLILALFLRANVFAASGTFTLKQIMSAPFASEPMASPTGAKVAWLENKEGRRNVYEAEAPDWKARSLTNFANDDGHDIGEMAWAHDGSYVVFVRGGDLENGGENPNPDLSPTTPEQEIWFANADGSALKKLTTGRGPAVSPVGGIIAFLRGGQIFTMLPTGEEVKNVVTAKGRQADLRWSHDGKYLAFVSVRRDHSFVGIYSLADKTLRYVDASTDRDSEPAWSPDDTRLAYLRIPSTMSKLGPAPQREGEPWSIRVLDLKSGTVQMAFRAERGAGSVFHAATANGQVAWAAGDRLIFPWERTGWCHLYCVSAGGGGTPVELTPGEGEVEHVALSADGKKIYYSTNIGDIDGRHLWSVAIDRAAAGTQQLTSGERIDWAPTPTADESALFYLSSSYREKAHPMVRASSNKTQSLTDELVPADFPVASLVKPQAVMITAADGMTVHGQLFLPPNAKPGERHPALAFFHGGSRRQMLLGFHYMYYYSNSFAMNEYLASLGYVVLSVNYRSGIGYGMKFREALDYGAAGGSEYRDVVGAGLYLKNRADVDPARIGVWGGSYGGYLTAMGLSRSSDLFAAGVDFHGVHDWSSLRDFSAPEGGDPKARVEYEEELRLAFDSSPMATVDNWKSPVLLIHGDDDRNVSFSQTVILAEALRARHVEFEELIFPNEIHDFLRYQDWVKAYEATAEFLGRKLK